MAADWQKRIQTARADPQNMGELANRRATGDILASLNCDEQYLPGALKTVHDFLNRIRESRSRSPAPSLPMAKANTSAISIRWCHIPRAIWFRFPVLTSSIFIRRRVIHERGVFLDTRWRDLGDFHWVLALMKNRVPMAVFDSFTSVFADTGENMNLKPNAVREKNETAAMTPGWVRMLKPVWIAHHRLRRLAAGHFVLKPTSNSIYTKQSLEQRVPRRAQAHGRRVEPAVNAHRR